MKATNTRTMSGRAGARVSAAVTYLCLTLFAVFVIAPLFWMCSTAFKNNVEIAQVPITLIPQSPSLDAFRQIFREHPLLTYFMNSVKLTVISTIASLLLATLGAYGASRYDFKGKKLFLSFLLVTQMFPSVMMIIPYYNVLNQMGLLGTHEGLLVLYSVGGVPFATWIMKGFYDTIPRELDEAARIDGCSAIRIFWQVVTPLAIPGVMSALIYTALNHWNEYQLAMTTIQDTALKTLPVGIAQLDTEYSITWNTVMAGSLVATLPLLILYIFAQRYFIDSLTAGAVKG